jgi:hypothetical protein
MNYYLLQPEVAGGLGNHTDLDRSVHPPRVSHLHYEFAGWLGDDLLESFPCYIITHRAADALAVSALSGFALADVEVSRSEEFDEVYGDLQLPPFRWLQITGIPDQDDFGFAKEGLVVSARAHEVLSAFKLNQCEVQRRIG